MSWDIRQNIELILAYGLLYNVGDKSYFTGL
jgi:hypothetical protein